MTGLYLRLVSARVPYWRGGVEFAHHPDRAYGLAIVALADLREGAIDDLLADPHVDVLIGDIGGWHEADIALHLEIEANLQGWVAEAPTVPDDDLGARLAAKPAGRSRK